VEQLISDTPLRQPQCYLSSEDFAASRAASSFPVCCIVQKQKSYESFVTLPPDLAL